MPAFDFGNKPANWLSFAKDLSILSPGFLPKNHILLRRYLQDTGKQTVEGIKKEMLDLEEENSETLHTETIMPIEPRKQVRLSLFTFFS